MKYNTVDIRFKGSHFSPKKLQGKLNLSFSKIKEAGEIAVKGRYKGVALPYGMAFIEITSPDSQSKVDDLLKEYCIKLIEWKDSLIECGVEEIIIDIENSKELPSDFFISKEIIQDLAKLNVSIQVHATNDSEIIEDESEKIKNILSILHKEDLYQIVVNNLKSHPLLLNEKILPYFLFFYSTENWSNNLDDYIVKFENFSKKMLSLK